jgi:hypothetical protein
MGWVALRRGASDVLGLALHAAGRLVRRVRPEVHGVGCGRAVNAVPGRSRHHVVVPPV